MAHEHEHEPMRGGAAGFEFEPLSRWEARRVADAAEAAALDDEGIDAEALAERILEEES
jgi:hypothetical protein